MTNRERGEGPPEKTSVRIAAPAAARPLISARDTLSLARALACLLAFGLVGGSAHANKSASAAMLSPASARRLAEAGIPDEPLRRALAAFSCARSRGLVVSSKLTLIDYSRPSTHRRLWVIDAQRGDVLFHELVAHGKGSGDGRASRFSNQEGSLQSSLGLFRTAETYHGRHGYSLRLDGLEPGVNDRARERALVIHGADYATRAFAARNGRLGRSWGCPAVDPRIHRELIDTIRGGTAVFAYYPDSSWLAESPYQSCETVTASR